MLNTSSTTTMYYGGVHYTFNRGPSKEMVNRILEVLLSMDESTQRIAAATGIFETTLPRIAEDVDYVKKKLEELGQEDPALKDLADRLEHAASGLKAIDDAIPDRETEGGGEGEPGEG